jgi:hypothetical protein
MQKNDLVKRLNQLTKKKVKKVQKLMETRILKEYYNRKEQLQEVLKLERKIKMLEMEVNEITLALEWYEVNISEMEEEE